MNTAAAPFNFLTEDHRMIAESARTLFGDLMAADIERRQLHKTRLDRGAIFDALNSLGLFGSDELDSTIGSALVHVQIAREAGIACLAYPILEMLVSLAVPTDAASDAAAITSMPTMYVDGADLPVFKAGQVSGVARRVAFAEWAKELLLWAQRGNEPVLLRVPLGVPGVTMKARTSVEPDYPLHDLQLQDVAATVVQLTAKDAGRLQERADLLATAEMTGACRRAVAMTRDYLLTRSQFGQVLASNQSLKHALADAHVRVEAAAAAIDYAAASFDARAADSTVSIAAAKLYAARAGKLVVESMLQLHGAIGYTMEYPLHLLIRRIHRLANSHATRDRLEKSLMQHFTACD